MTWGFTVRTTRDTKGGNASKAKSSAEKEFQKLRRMDLLELLLDQIRENDQLSTSVAELTDLSERLKAKLNDKDAQIERLKAKLDDKDAQIERLEERNRAVARASGTLDIKEFLEIEGRAIENYLMQLSDESNDEQA